MPTWVCAMAGIYGCGIQESAHLNIKTRHCISGWGRVVPSGLWLARVCLPGSCRRSRPTVKDVVPLRGCVLPVIRQRLRWGRNTLAGIGISGVTGLEFPVIGLISKQIHLSYFQKIKLVSVFRSNRRKPRYYFS